MNQDKTVKELKDFGDFQIPTICAEEEGIEKLIENFKQLKQQNYSLLERVRLLEGREKKDNNRCKHDLGSGENLLKVPNNSSSDPSSSISVSPDISCTDSISEQKQLVQNLSSSEEDLDTDLNEAKQLENSLHYPKKYLEKETTDDSSGLNKKCSQKEHKTAWSKMKEIITTTKVGGTKKRHNSEVAGDNSKLSDEQEFNQRIAVQNEARLQAPRLVLTHPSTEDLNKTKSSEGVVKKLHEKHRPSPLQPTWQDTSPVDEDGQGEISPPLTRKSSKWFKVKNVFLPSPGSHSNKSTSNPSSPLTFKSFTYEVDPEDSSSFDHLNEGGKDINTNIQDEVKKNYKQLQKKLSDEFHCKFVEWEKGRKCGGSFSSGNSSVDECERRRIQETEELRSYGGGPDTTMTPPEKKLTTEFKKKLEEWDRLKSGNEGVPSSPGREHPRRKISDWQGWGRANTQRKKEDGKKRRGSDSPVRKDGHSVKELAWIDKELAKVDKEKLRLEKERDKFNQREARLKKMKLALEASREEVLIPTSTGTFRFHGISEKFTKKLYEWEKARDIGPEASTIALLDPTYCLKVTNHCTGESSGAMLTRSKSIGSVADLATPLCQLTNHPSSLSLNNVELLDEPMSQIVSPIKVEETEGFSSTAVTPDFSVAPDEQHLIDSSGSDLDNEIIKLSRKRGAYQYCHESKCLIEKLKKEREMCRELEQNIESLEGRISELSKSLERIDASGGRNCGMIHDVPFKINGQGSNGDDFEEDCDTVGRDEVDCTMKEGLNEIWLLSQEQALNQLHHLTQHLLQIVEKLDSWVMHLNNGQETFENEQNENLNKIDYWITANHQTDRVDYKRDEHEVIDLTSFTNLMKEKICEVQRVLGYLFSKKDMSTRNLNSGPCEDEMGDNIASSYLFSHSDKSQNDMEMQDTENDCSSRASSFTYQTPDFREKQFDENWDWSKSNFKPFQKDSYSRLARSKQCLEDNDKTSSYSDLDGNILSSVYKINESGKSEFLHDLTSHMGVLKPWDNRSDLHDENQFEIISDISPNIVVPTVRKIFSPVFLEENGETSFIEVVIDEDEPKIKDMVASGTASQNELNFNENNNNGQLIYDHEKFETDNESGTLNKKSNEFNLSDNFDDVVTHQQSKDMSCENINKSDETQNWTDLMEIDNTDTIESEEEKPYFDIGFPPISPLRGRREFKSPKETSSLKRMIAARQNKKLYDIDLCEARGLRSDSSSPDSKSGASERNSEIKIDTVKKSSGTNGREFYKSVSSSHMRVNSTDRYQSDILSNQFPTKGILKSSSTSALKTQNDFENIQHSESDYRNSVICESISILEEKNKFSDQPLSTPESLKLRALKIQKAKEDFFNNQLLKNEHKKEVKINAEPKCEMKEANSENSILTKSASEGTVNLTEEINQCHEITTLKKSKFSGITSKLNVVLRKSGTTSADSSLRRSVAIPPNHQVNPVEQEPTRSCPSSPILLREEPTWWPLNPAKMIFRPKGKYKFNNNK